MKYQRACICPPPPQFKPTWAEGKRNPPREHLGKLVWVQCGPPAVHCQWQVLGYLTNVRRRDAGPRLSMPAAWVELLAEFADDVAPQLLGEWESENGVALNWRKFRKPGPFAPTKRTVH